MSHAYLKVEYTLKFVAFETYNKKLQLNIFNKRKSTFCLKHELLLYISMKNIDFIAKVFDRRHDLLIYLMRQFVFNPLFFLESKRCITK